MNHNLKAQTNVVGEVTQLELLLEIDNQEIHKKIREKSLSSDPTVLLLISNKDRVFGRWLKLTFPIAEQSSMDFPNSFPVALETMDNLSDLSDSTVVVLEVPGDMDPRRVFQSSFQLSRLSNMGRTVLDDSTNPIHPNDLSVGIERPGESGPDKRILNLGSLSVGSERPGDSGPGRYLLRLFEPVSSLSVGSERPGDSGPDTFRVAMSHEDATNLETLLNLMFPNQSNVQEKSLLGVSSADDSGSITFTVKIGMAL